MTLNKRLLLLTGWLLLAWMGSAWSKAPACPAYEQLRPLLNSERIQACFGSYGVEVLVQQGNLRISSLYSLGNDTVDSVGGRLRPNTNESIARERAPTVLPLAGEASSGRPLAAETRITRTLAISEFAGDLPEALQAAYQAIRGGASMGATLEAAGWRVDKRQRYLGEVPVSTNLHCLSDLPADSPQQWAVQVYDLWVLRDDAEVRFALLAELHDPRYLTLQDLQRIYSAMINQQQFADPAFERLLQQAGQLCKTQD